MLPEPKQTEIDYKKLMEGGLEVFEYYGYPQPEFEVYTPPPNDDFAYPDRIFIVWIAYKDVDHQKTEWMSSRFSTLIKNLEPMNVKQRTEYLIQILKRSIGFAILVTEREERHMIEEVLAMYQRFPTRSLFEALLMTRTQAIVDQNIRSIPELVDAGMTEDKARSLYTKTLETTPTPEFVIGMSIPDIKTEVALMLSQAYRKATTANELYEKRT